jgi:hypothetical protein
MKNKLITSEIQTDTTIRLRFEGGSWASMTFQHYKENDWWQVVISSDWGDWSHGWGRSGMGTDIFNFMARDSRSYLINKFSKDNDIFSIQKTMTAMRKHIREEHPWIDDKEENEKFMYMISELSSCESIDQVYNAIDKELCEELGDEIWHFMKHEWHPREKYFFTHIFPKFMPEIKKLAKFHTAKVSA